MVVQGSEVRGVFEPAHAAAVVLMSNVSGTAAKAAGGWRLTVDCEQNAPASLSASASASASERESESASLDMHTGKIVKCISQINGTLIFKRINHSFVL